MSKRLIASAILLRDRAGAAAVEFALILPIAISLFLGTFELANLLMCHMKLVAATQTAADLLAQQKTVCASDVTSYGTAAGLVMEPLPPGKLSIAFASVIYTSSSPFTASTDWHQEVNGATSIATIAPTAATNAQINKYGSSSTIVATATYAYTSPLSYMLKKNYTFTETAFAQPRLVASIPKPTC